MGLLLAFIVNTVKCNHLKREGRGGEGKGRRMRIGEPVGTIKATQNIVCVKGELTFNLSTDISMEVEQML